MCQLSIDDFCDILYERRNILIRETIKICDDLWEEINNDKKGKEQSLIYDESLSLQEECDHLKLKKIILGIDDDGVKLNENEIDDLQNNLKWLVSTLYILTDFSGINPSNALSNRYNSISRAEDDAKKGRGEISTEISRFQDDAKKGRGEISAEISRFQDDAKKGRSELQKEIFNLHQKYATQPEQITRFQDDAKKGRSPLLKLFTEVCDSSNGLFHLINNQTNKSITDSNINFMVSGNELKETLHNINKDFWHISRLIEWLFVTSYKILSFDKDSPDLDKKKEKDQKPENQIVIKLGEILTGKLIKDFFKTKKKDQTPNTNQILVKIEEILNEKEIIVDEKDKGVLKPPPYNLISKSCKKIWDKVTELKIKDGKAKKDTKNSHGCLEDSVELSSINNKKELINYLLGIQDGDNSFLKKLVNGFFDRFEVILNLHVNTLFYLTEYPSNTLTLAYNRAQDDVKKGRGEIYEQINRFQDDAKKGRAEFLEDLGRIQDDAKKGRAKFLEKAGYIDKVVDKNEVIGELEEIKEIKDEDKLKRIDFFNLLNRFQDDAKKGRSPFSHIFYILNIQQLKLFESNCCEKFNDFDMKLQYSFEAYSWVLITAYKTLNKELNNNNSQQNEDLKNIENILKSLLNKRQLLNKLDKDTLYPPPLAITPNGKRKNQRKEVNNSDINKKHKELVTSLTTICNNLYQLFYDDIRPVSVAYHDVKFVEVKDEQEKDKEKNKLKKLYNQFLENQRDLPEISSQLKWLKKTVDTLIFYSGNGVPSDKPFERIKAPLTQSEIDELS